MSDIQLGRMYKAIVKNKKGEPWDYVIPIKTDVFPDSHHTIHDYVEIEYVETGNGGIIEIPRFLQRYELA